MAEYIMDITHGLFLAGIRQTLLVFRAIWLLRGIFFFLIDIWDSKYRMATADIGLVSHGGNKYCFKQVSQILKHKLELLQRCISYYLFFQ